MLLSGDRHHDNAHTDRALEKRHLDLARERKALVIDVGDLFCAMQGKYDPRSSKSALRDEHKRDDYLDALVEEAAKFYGPYADLFAVLGQGNHESSILNRLGTNLTNSLVRELNGINKANGSERVVKAGGYGGWIKFQFKIRKTVGQNLNMKYFHDAGGGGPVTRGVIQTNRQAVYLPDADFVLTGHVHEAWVVPITRERLSTQGKISQDIQWHIKVPTYKQEYGDGSGGWHVETGKPPKPLGCCWIRLWLEGSEVRHSVSLDLR